jgi:phage head maturation protease
VTGQVERRYFATEVRALKGGRIGGYAALFMPARSLDLGGFVEQVAREAFDEAR